MGRLSSKLLSRELLTICVDSYFLSRGLFLWVVPEVKRLRLLYWRGKNGGKRATFPKTYVGLDFLKVLQVLENHDPCALGMDW